MKYKIQKSKYPDQEGTHIICKYVSNKRGMCSGRIFKGSLKDCETKLREIKELENGK